jgi:hypothetical protein
VLDLAGAYRVPQPGDRQISAEFLRAVVRELTRQAHVSSEFGDVEQAPGGLLLRALPGVELVWARLTAEASGAYAWKELSRTGLNAWADKTGGRSGTTTSSAARDVNGTTGLPVGATTGAVVRLVKGWGEASTASAVAGTVNQEWLFDHNYNPAAAAAGISLRETSVNSIGVGTLYAGVSELRCDYGETFQDSAGNARVGYSGRLLAFDTAAGDSAFSVPSGGYVTPTAVTFATSMSPTPWATADQAPSVGNSYFSPSREGWYLLTASAVWEANATGYRFLAIGNVSNVPLGATASLVVPPSGGVECFQNVAAVVYLASGTDAYLLAAQTSGAARNIYRAYFTGQRLG